MANQLSELLAHWYPQRDEAEWVLGTVYKTEGPCYRKGGAMMLFNSLGQQFGMLSGGCLESDIQKHARRVMQEGKAITLCYDGSDEDDLAFQLGIGCGGTVHILLQPIRAEQQYLRLEQLYQSLQQRRAGIYYQCIPGPEGTVASRFLNQPEQLNSDAKHGKRKRSELVQQSGQQWLITAIDPEPHLLVAGGGFDARPLVAMAAQLGWKVSLWDPRPANARREYFMQADSLLAGEAAELTDFCLANSVDAAVLMCHNLQMDADVLNALCQAPLPHQLKYLALLGPDSRRERVEQLAGFGHHTPIAIAGPAGLDLGGELPESIALSILAECHASLHQRSAQSFSHYLNSPSPEIGSAQSARAQPASGEMAA